MIKKNEKAEDSIEPQTFTKKKIKERNGGQRTDLEQCSYADWMQKYDRKIRASEYTLSTLYVCTELSRSLLDCIYSQCL